MGKKRGAKPGKGGGGGKTTTSRGGGKATTLRGGRKTPSTPKTAAQVECELAARARTRYLQEKKRIASSRAAWARRFNDPEKVVTSVENALEKYRTTHSRADYSRFRMWKRRLYFLMPKEAGDILEQAAEESGWKEAIAAKFARLS